MYNTAVELYRLQAPPQNMNVCKSYTVQDVIFMGDHLDLRQQATARHSTAQLYILKVKR